jgi:hypothetical protein
MPKVIYNSTKGLYQSAGTGISLEGNLVLTGSTTVSSTLNVAGSATLASTLNVAGSATLASTLSVDGSATLSGALFGSIDTREDAGVVSLDKITTRITLTGDANRALTLAAGTAGQIKFLVCTSKGGAGNGVLTPAGGLADGANTTITFDAIGDSIALVYLGTPAKWAVLSNNGCTLA